MLRRALALAVLFAACRREPEPAPITPPPSRPQLPVAPASLPPVHVDQVVGTPPPAQEPLPQVIAQVLQQVGTGSTKGLAGMLSEVARRRMQPGVGTAGSLPIQPATIAKRLGGGPIEQVIHQGGRAVVLVRHGSRLDGSYFYLEKGRWTYDPIDMTPFSQATPGPPDPLNQPLTLEQATAGLPGTGTLTAILDTSAGTVRCSLDERGAPLAVANFVGLARGLRASVKTQAGPQGRILTTEFQKKPMYDGLPFYRAVPNLLVEVGDPLARGTGHAGYQIPDELDLRVRHDRAGVLGMASRGPNTSSSAFYVTLQPAPWLDDRHTIFGQCQDLDIVKQIAQVPAGTVTLRTVTVRRGP